MVYVRLRTGVTYQVKPGTDILFVEYSLEHRDWRIQFIDNFTGKMINFTASEIARIF